MILKLKLTYVHRCTKRHISSRGHISTIKNKTNLFTKITHANYERIFVTEK
ncbi:unnamed protein product [Prunus brigantina]